MLTEPSAEYLEAKAFFAGLFPNFSEITWDKLAFIAEQYRIGEYH